MAELNQLEISPENWRKITKNNGNENWPLEIQIVIENSGGKISFRIPPNTVKNVIDDAILEQVADEATLEQVAEAAKKPERVAGVARVAKKLGQSFLNLMGSDTTAVIGSQPDDVTKKCIVPQLINGEVLMEKLTGTGEEGIKGQLSAGDAGAFLANKILPQIEKTEKKYKDLIEIEKKSAELASQEPDPTPNPSDMNWKVVEKKQSITRRVRGLTSVTLRDVNNPGNEITIRMSKKEAEASKFTIGKTVNHFDLYECGINKITHGNKKMNINIDGNLDLQLETLVESHKSPNKPGEGSRRSILGGAAGAARAADEARAAATAAIRRQALTEEKNSKLKALGISSDLWDERDSNEIIIEIVNKTTIKIPPNDKTITLKEKTIDAVRKILNFDEAYAREELKEMIANPRDVKATFELIDRITSETPDVGKGLIQKNKLKEVVQNGYQGKKQVGLKTRILNDMVTNAKESYAEIVKIDDQLEQIEVDNNRPSTLSH